MLRLTGTAATEHRQIVFDFRDPYLELQRLVREAAAIEHALLVQYLYAGLSLRAPYADTLRGDGSFGDDGTMFGVAIQEMKHLAVANGLLVALGSPPNLDREEFPAAFAIYPFAFELEPLSPSSLAKYVYAESPKNALDPKDPANANDLPFIERVLSLLKTPNVNHVGSLYGAILEKLDEVVASPPPNLPDLSLFKTKLVNVRQQGEHDHYQFFRAVLEGKHPSFEAVGDVWSLPKTDDAYPSRPLLTNPSAFEGHPRQIEDATTRKVAWLSNLHYWLVLGLLELCYRFPGGPYLGMAKQHMTVALLPLGLSLAERNCGCPFDPLDLNYDFGLDESRARSVLVRLTKEIDPLLTELKGQLPTDPGFDQVHTTTRKLLGG